MTSPRAPLIPPEEWDPEFLEFVKRASVVEGEPLNFFRVMACYPVLATKWTRFAGHLLSRGRLQARHRELLILRTVWNCGAEYEWVHHSRLAGEAGISPAEIAALQQGPDVASWSQPDAALIRAADELNHGSKISDATWEELGPFFDDADRLEIVMLVGNYHLVSFFVRSFAVPLEPGVTDGRGSDS